MFDTGTPFADLRRDRLLKIDEGTTGRMSRKTMLLFDSFTVRREAVQYAIELAKRTNTGLVVLVLLSADEDDPEAADELSHELSRFEKSLIGHMESAQAAGISAEAVVKTGDPSSEFVKFLAASGSLQTIVWGGQQELARASVRGKKPHWLIRMKDVVECPVVVPSRKS